MRIPILSLLVACAPAKRDPASWAEQLPRECSSNELIEPLACELPPEPPGACVVEQRDLATDTLAYRLVFVGETLVRHEETITDVERTITAYLYDGRGRLSVETSCMTATGEPASWIAPWLSSKGQRKEPTTHIVRSERFYKGRALSSGTVAVTTQRGERISSYKQQMCYAYGDQDRRAARLLVHRDDAPPGSRTVNLRTYQYGQHGLDQIAYSDLEGGQFKPEREARYVYDEQGRLASIESGRSRTTYRFDDRGRLIGYEGIAFEWDDADRLTAMRGRGLDQDFTYDASGRIAQGRIPSGDGYRVIYGAACPPGLSHPRLTPNADSFLYYEGKDNL